MKARIKKAIEERLQVAPYDYGLPLRKSLKRYWKLRVGDYRIVYKIDNTTVMIFCICHRKNIKLLKEGCKKPAAPLVSSVPTASAPASLW